MSNRSTVSILNELLAAEYSNLIQRLAEATPFITWPAAEDGFAVQRMLADAKRHQHELVDMILRLRGSPNPPTFPISMGGVHYLTLSYLMPQVIASVRDLVQRYERAGATGHPEADALVGRILSDHKRDLAELDRMHSNLAAVAR